MKRVPVVFFGTPEVAARALEVLVRKSPALGYEIAQVVTQPPGPRRRGKGVGSQSPVYRLASKLSLPVATPYKVESVNDDQNAERVMARLINLIALTCR